MFRLVALVLALVATEELQVLAKKTDPGPVENTAFQVDAQGRPGEVPAVGLNRKDRKPTSVDGDMKAHMAPKGDMAPKDTPSMKVDEGEKLIRSHEVEKKPAPSMDEVSVPEEGVAPRTTPKLGNAPAAEEEAMQWRNLNLFWMGTVGICMFLLLAMVVTAIYFKRQAESLKQKAVVEQGESENDESEADEASSYDTNNPKVMVNKQLLDRMTSISMKLKASVLKARSESSSSQSSKGRAPRTAAGKEAAAGGEVRMED